MRKLFYLFYHISVVFSYVFIAILLRKIFIPQNWAFKHDESMCTVSDAQYENRVRHFYISGTPVKCCNNGCTAEYNNSTIYFIKREFVRKDNIV